MLRSSEGLYMAYMAPSVSSRAFTVLLCVYVGHFVTFQKHLITASGLLYEAMGMTPSDPSQTLTHISKRRQISHAFFPLLLHLLHDLLPLLIALVAGKVLIGLFPKLFLVKDKQGRRFLGRCGVAQSVSLFL